MSLRPEMGPHDDGMSTREWFNITLARVAEDDNELKNFERFIQVLRQEYLATDVHTLKSLSMTQLLMAAASELGENAKKGMVRIFLKYMGTAGHPHEPPLPCESEAFNSCAQTKVEEIRWGKAGKSGINSQESNFPEAMVVSSKHAHIKHGSELQFPEDIKTMLAIEAAKHSEDNPMDQGVTMRITHAVADWIVQSFGVSPVCGMPCSCMPPVGSHSLDPLDFDHTLHAHRLCTSPTFGRQ